MKLSEMITLLGVYADDVIDTTTATTLFNAGQNAMAVDIKASFPQLVSTNVNDTFIFPEKYHEAPILYAASMIKAQDSSIREKGSFLDQFMNAKADFVENWTVPARYRDDQNTQQFTAVAGQATFVITSDVYSYQYSNLKVYVNNALTSRFRVPTMDLGGPYLSTTITSTDPKSFTLIEACAAGDAVTAVWEINQEYQQPPLPWWSF
jgi:hypothetical protein